ncbi:hypothetical protein HN371_11565 [Candidatus Poribacteria bacterium]|nr:hypothetical protein [Candidatus Poribacteria bacterium]MBT5535879.1 hypothetical protein [Candidatus Poribacteria bacterium]MBT5711840.1 hypothetical protein [Candidatus Poribacteria bacterium]MBT7099898.1 hypothetical protein [Candidatus Poribacteria bacterium]MBT7804923.1 hypothetical protein [Candidatus Poribacteria bacterium]
MSGIVGHMTYAILASEAAARRELRVAALIRRHYASYLAGAYLGCDIQTLPASVCEDTGGEVGYGAGHLERSPITGGATRRWTLELGGNHYSPHTIYEVFYGRSHLTFGWSQGEAHRALPWDDLPGYFSAVLADVDGLFDSDERPLAYVLGWITHVIGDALIKGVQSGIDLHLLDGRYTPRNRPIQDLISFHEVGREELGLDWERLMGDLVNTPVEPIQLHYMRVSKPRGRLAELHPDAWTPEHEPLLRETLAENRRYQRIRNGRILRELALTETASDWECSEELSHTAGGLRYGEMLELAEAADFRGALSSISDRIADMFELLEQDR